MKIRTKLAFTITGAIVTALLITGVGTFLFGIRTLSKNSFKHLESVATVQAARFDDMVQSNLDRLRLVSSRTQLRRSLAEFNWQPNPVAQQKITAILIDVKTSVDSINNIFVLNNEGVVVASTLAETQVINPFQEYSTSSHKQNKSEVILLFDEDKGLILYLHTKLILENLEIGSIVLNINIDDFIQVMSTYGTLGVSGESYIARLLPDGRAQIISPTRFNPDAAFKLLIPDNQENSLELQAFQQSEGVIQDLVDYRGVNVFGVAYPVLKNDWRLIVKVDRSEALEPIITWRNKALVIFGILSFFSVLFSILLSRQLSGSISRLTQQITDFGSGRFPQLTHSNESDWEVCQLENAFINMAETRNSIEQLAKKNEQYYTLMLNSTGEGVIATDVNGLITKINPVAEQLTGCLSESALGKPLIDIFNIIDSETRTQIKSLIDQVITQEHAIISGDNSLLVSKSGHEYPIAGNVWPLKEKDTIHGTIIVFQDITEEYKLRAEQEEHRLFFKNILNDMQTFAGVLNPDGTSIFINNTAFLDADFGETEVIGKHFTDTPWFSQNEETQEQVKLDITKAAKGQSSIRDIQILMGENPLWVQFSIHPLFDKEGNVKYLIPEGQLIQQRIEIEHALRKSKERLRLHQELTTVGFIEWDENFKVSDWNPAATKIFGYSLDEAIGKTANDLMVPEAAKETVNLFWVELVNQRGETHRIFENISKSGQIIICEWFNTSLKDESGHLIGVASIVRDITEQRQQEEQLRRSQKLDALGQLTGGIAHDFNNMLNIMLGYTELVKAQVNENPKLDGYFDQIEQAGARCSDLTRKLLGFSRSKPEAPSKLNINDEIIQSKNILEKSLTARITIKLKLQDNVWPVFINASEFQDTLINLSINAMHAMHGMQNSGTLTISTANTTLDRVDAGHLDLEKGDYIKFSISDTGCGIKEGNLAHIFDPFFSTKGDKGTGLGLSQVYGFLKRAEGTIKVYSEINIGSRFDIYFPRFINDHDLHSNNVIENKDEKLNHFSPDNEKILFVDDEFALREFAYEILTKHKYDVVCASNGEDALKILESMPVALVLSDIIMPGMSGHELVRKISERHPEIKTQLMCGFDNEENTQNENNRLLLKPFVAKNLLKKVRTLLDE